MVEVRFVSGHAFRHAVSAAISRRLQALNFWNEVPAMLERLTSAKRALVRTFGVLALLWILTCGALFEVMRQPPETFARFMTRLPAPIAFVVLPFETLWTQARAGSLQVGDLAPDFSLMKLDKSSPMRFSVFAAERRPVVLVFGSYT